MSPALTRRTFVRRLRGARLMRRANPRIMAAQIPLVGQPVRTCNQTVMSGRLSTSFVDFAAFLFELDRVRRGLFVSFVVRNWCGR